MDLKTYSELALRTAKELPSPFMNLWHAAVGIQTETGEILDAFKKHMIYGKELDLANLAEEVGDLMWYVNLLAHHQNLRLADCEGSVLQPDVYHYPELPEEQAKQMTLLAELSCLAGYAYLAVMETTVQTSAAEQPTILEWVETIGTLIDLSNRLAKLCGLTLEQVLETNIAKLAKRYGDRYSDYAAINRDVAAEREILNGAVLRN